MDLLLGEPSGPVGPCSRLVGVDVIPSAGTWTVDHADVWFIGRRLGLRKVRGRFGSVTGSIAVGEHPSDSQVQVTLRAATVSTGDDEQDARLRSGDFLDVNRHPTAAFASTSVELDGTHASVRGNLTIIGISRPVVLDVELLGVVTDPWGGVRAVFSASTEIDREDWGLTWNMALPTGGLLLSKRVRIEVELEAVPTAFGGATR
jgi:polyisoprenoid-binding protein YceI